jgi:hypothetical protein
MYNFYVHASKTVVVFDAAVGGAQIIMKLSLGTPRVALLIQH